MAEREAALDDDRPAGSGHVQRDSRSAPTRATTLRLRRRSAAEVRDAARGAESQEARPSTGALRGMSATP